MTGLTTAETTHRSELSEHRSAMDWGAVLARGAMAGLAAGLLFILANMWYASGHGKPLVAPFLAISTIFHGADKPVLSQPDVIAGLVLHLAFSLVFGIVFALSIVLLEMLVGVTLGPAMLTVAAVGYGLALYVVNIQIIGRTLFPWFTNPKGPNQLFELWIHPIAFGLILVPFFLGFRPSARRGMNPGYASPRAR